MMSGAIQILLRHGSQVFFGVVLAEQIGLRLPAIPFLLTGRVMAGVGKIGPMADRWTRRVW